MRNRRSGSSKPYSKTISTTDTERSLLGLFVESVRDYAILTMDAAGLITSWNIGAQRLKGYRVEEILGKPWSVFYTPEDIARGWPGEITRRAIAEGRAQDEGLRVRKDGTQFLARIVLSTVRDEHDVLRGFIEVTQDISDQRRAEKELRDSEERFRSFSQKFSRIQLDRGLGGSLSIR
jgi:PAS domain S-box-containing protein